MKHIINTFKWKDNEYELSISTFNYKLSITFVSMIAIDNVLISNQVVEEQFVCDLINVREVVV